MTDTVTPVLADVYTVLKAFIVSVTGLDQSVVIQGLANRAAMPPPSPGFISMTAILKRRLRTNVDSYPFVDDPNANSLTSEQGIALTVQIDCYGPASSDWADMLSTLLRDDAGCAALAPACQPLYCDDPRMAPLIDAEAQYEQRWIVGASLQYNPVTTIPQQFADALTLGVINVDERYKP